MRHHTRSLVRPVIRLRPGLLAWLPLVAVIVAACGKGSGSGY